MSTVRCPHCLRFTSQASPRCYHCGRPRRLAAAPTTLLARLVIATVPALAVVATASWMQGAADPRTWQQMLFLGVVMLATTCELGLAFAWLGTVRGRGLRGAP